MHARKYIRRIGVGRVHAYGAGDRGEGIGRSRSVERREFEVGIGGTGEGALLCLVCEVWL